MNEVNDIQSNYLTGYIKLFRSLKNKGWFKKSDYVHLWIYILIQATHKQTEFFFNGENMILRPGQFVTGRKIINSDTGINESKIERILTFFEKNEQQIEQLKTNRNRLITVVSWEQYQQVEQQIEQPVNNKRTTSEQPVNTYKNDNNYNNEKNEKNNNILLSQVDESTLDHKDLEYFKIAISFWELIKSSLTELNISNNEIVKAKYKTWVDPIRLLIETDKRNVSEFREVFNFLKTDEFWKEQIRSTAKLRKKNKDQRTYFEVLLEKSRNGQKRKQSSVNGSQSNSGVSQAYKDDILRRLYAGTGTKEMPGN